MRSACVILQGNLIAIRLARLAGSPPEVSGEQDGRRAVFAWAVYDLPFANHVFQLPLHHDDSGF